MMDEEIRQALCEVREMKKMCGNINMKLTNIVTQRGQDYKKKLEAEYQRGFEDGKWKSEDGCTGCQYEGKTGEHLPCDYCMNNFKNQWTAKDDEIEVGDEVVWTEDENVVIVVTCVYTENNMEWCDGFCRDGKVYQILTEHARKTGRHFDIQNILEAIKHD